MTDLCQILAAALLFLAAAVHAVPRVEEPFTELELEQATGRVMGKRGELFGKRGNAWDALALCPVESETFPKIWNVENSKRLI